MNKSKKVLEEKRGRIAMSEGHKSIQNSSESSEIKIKQNMLELIKEVEAYNFFVKQSINSLGSIEGAKFRGRKLKEKFMLAEPDPFLDLEIFKGFGLAFGLNSLEESTDELFKIKRTLMADGVSPDIISKTSKVLKNITDIAEKVIITYKDLDPGDGISIAKKNSTMLDSMVNKLYSIVNRVKSIFGFHVSLQKEILEDLQGMQTRARETIAPKI